MTEVKNVELELARFRERLFVVAVCMALAMMLLAARAGVLQLLRHEDLSARAEANRTAIVPIVPNRGLIVDRHGVVLASNYSAYTLEITPSKVRNLEATLDALAEVVEIQPQHRRRFKRLMEDSKRFDSLPIRTRLSEEDVARFSAQRFRFPGVELRARLFRHYPMGDVGSHLIGYIGRINASEKAGMEDWEDQDAANYRGTDYIGKLGVEQRYERQLHGITGYHEVETSAAGRAIRRLDSRGATPGNTVRLSVDIRLQWLVEQLYGGRRGALVAIDPRNGEVLALVSMPTFDPNLFVEGIDAESWRELNESIDKPLLNRALRGTYPPGSTFKPFMGLAALHSGKRRAETVIHDGGTFTFGGHVFRSSGDRGAGSVNLHSSIVRSSNVYYYTLANEMGVDLMHEQLGPLGFGRRTGIDLDGEVTGVLPSTEWKRRAYRKPEQQRWYAGETISLGIGQGYNNFTMLQLAHAMATLAAGGQRHTPRVVREIRDVVTQGSRPTDRPVLEPLPYKPDHIEAIRRAMHGVTQEGTSTRVFAGAPYASGGKTGTAQAVSVRQNEKYNAAKLAEHQRDHSLYVAFAPLDKPTIALAVIVENAGFGAAAAAPIARRVFDYWLEGRWPSDEDIASTQRGESAAPLGLPRRAQEVALPGAAAPEPGMTPAPRVAVKTPDPARP